MPKFAHTPLLRNADKSKLSKRKNPTGIEFYRRMGYLPQALANFLGLLASPPLDGEEIMDLPAMVERFRLEHVSVGGPVFDVAKLDWLNGRYLRERLDLEGFKAQVRGWALNQEYLGRIAPLAQPRIERLSDLGPLLAFFFAGRINPDPALLRSGKLDEQALRRAFVLALDAFERLEEWTIAGVEAAVRSVAEKLEAKLRDVVRPFYVAVTGSAQSVPLFDSMEILGRELVRERFRSALAALGGATAAEQEAWTK
jgi:glutamyl-tRNA synthetase